MNRRALLMAAGAAALVPVVGRAKTSDSPFPVYHGKSEVWLAPNVADMLLSSERHFVQPSGKHSIWVHPSSTSRARWYLDLHLTTEDDPHGILAVGSMSKVRGIDRDYAVIRTWRLDSGTSRPFVCGTSIVAVGWEPWAAALDDEAQRVEADVARYREEWYG